MSGITPAAVAAAQLFAPRPRLMPLVLSTALALQTMAADHKAQVGTPVQMGRFWGETPGLVRSLIPKGTRELFHWEGEVKDYAVLEITETGVVEQDCGRGGVRAGLTRWNGKEVELRDSYLVLSACTGHGRVRVVQCGRVSGGARPLVEIDNLETHGPSRYVLEAHVVPKSAVERLHVPPAEVADRWSIALQAETSGDIAGSVAQWSGIATHVLQDDARLWAIEKLCMLRPYPGSPPNPVEQKTLEEYAAKESIENLAGANVILAWPKDYVATTPTRWRFLAEMDAALDWLKVWTGKDQVAARGKRLIVNFRPDNGGTALFAGFRLHIPRAEMKYPPNHGPYSHEASHGFIGFPSICPNGRYGEGLTEVSRTGYWWFLGLDQSWKPFRLNCLHALADHRNKGATLDKVPSYAAAAGVYFSIEEAIRSRPGDLPDWALFGKLFETARNVDVKDTMTVPERFELFTAVCEKAFGPKTRTLIKSLGPPN